MDFLEIRRKAKERAAARARRDAAGGARRGTTSGVEKRGGQKRRSAARRAGAPAEVGVVTEADVVEGALMAEMQGRSEPPADDGFLIVRGPPAAPPGPAEARPAGEAGSEVAAWTGARPGNAPRARAEVRPQAADAPVDPLEEFFYSEAEAPPAPASDPGEGSAAALREVLVFELGAEEYALDIGVVREILRAPPITEVPRAPAHVLGITMVRGQVIAVHDPRRRLGLGAAPAGPGARVVVCDAGRGPLGLLVDGVSQVLRLPPSALEPRPQGIAGIDSDFIAGVGRAGERFFVLLDTEALLGRQEPGAGTA
ncbi:MAG TPA: chemotaxis protein CheW [Anaeromyxobacteraceae bacterium]|nr:chemotaxis protein CheW [Anaeromyxobacteraceae bacterium]